MQNVRIKGLFLFIVFTMLVGSIYSYPDIRFISELGKDFKGITMTGTADEAFYLARLKAVYQGDYSIANIGLYEHKNDRWLTPPYFEVILASIGKFIKMPVQYLDIVFSFVFPVVIFWLIYLLIYKISRSVRLALVGACTILFGYAIVSTQFKIISSILNLQYSQPLFFLRSFSPQFIYIPFILCLLLIFMYIDSNLKGRICLVSLCLTSLNYLHLYLWAFLCAGLSVWMLVALITKKSLIFKNIMIVLLLSGVLSIPYWINHYFVVQSPNYHFLELLFAVEHSRRMILPKAYILISMIVLFFTFKSQDKKYWFLFSFLTGGIVCLNQQIFTGMIMEPVHWTNYTNKTFLIIAVIATLNNLSFPYVCKIKFGSKAGENLKNLAFIVIVIFLVLCGFLQQNNYFNENKGRYTQLQALGGPAEWLKENTAKNDVILTDSIAFPGFVFIRELLLYTNNFHYLVSESHSLMSIDEKEDRTMFAMSFFVYSDNEAENIFNFWKGLNFIGGSARFSLTGDMVTIDLDKYVEKLRDKWKRLGKNNPLEVLLRYKVDYIMLAKGDHLFDDIEARYGEIIKVYEDSIYKIFKIKDKNIQ